MDDLERTIGDLPDPAWSNQAACLDYDPVLWFPAQDTSPKVIDEAKAICWDCPVRDQCLQFALDTRQKYGIWGGLSYQQRLKARREVAA